MITTYISQVEKPNKIYHRSKVIIHQGMFHYAEFDTMAQLERHAKLLGFTYKLKEESYFLCDEENIYRRYEMSHTIVDAPKHFWKLEELPKEAKPFTALSNGSLVTCYFVKEKKKITVYRPNPNCELYVPLFDTKGHIEYVNKNGTY